MTNQGPIGQQRNIGAQVLLSIITFGLYGVYWTYQSHDDVKRHSGEGVGGVLIYLLVGVVTLFLLPVEIKKMYEADGQVSPVGPGTAFWILLFGIPWYVKCQSALNRYWASQGAPSA